MSKIQLSSDIVNDKFTEFLYHAYDIQNKEKTITEIPIPNDDDMKIIMNRIINVVTRFIRYDLERKILTFSKRRRSI